MAKILEGLWADKWFRWLCYGDLLMISAFIYWVQT